MSHFSLLVISDEKITEETLKTTLQPWHEYGCGVDDQYVIDVDVTDEVHKEFNDPQKVVIESDGLVYSRWDDRFYTKKPKDSWSNKEFELPEGASEKEFSAEEARKHGIGYATLLECAKEYYADSAKQVGDRFFKKDNPNSKWDWWQVGGRWTGMFRPNYDPNKDPANKEVCIICYGVGKRFDAVARAAGVTKCNGCDGTGIATKWPTQWKSVGDIAQIKNIPFDALRDVAEVKALETYDKVRNIIRDRKIPNWDKMLADNFGDSEKTRNDFWADPVVKDLQEEKDFAWDVQYHLENAALSRTERAIRARREAIQTFAVVKDGQWYQRGEMGWWGVVHNEKDKDEWSNQFETLLANLSPDTWLAVVDCHT